MGRIAEKIAQIRSAIPSHVTLVAVSKKKPVEMIMEAYEAGQRDFGENYVQELTEKQRQLPSDIRWHFIGHLQSNKIRLIAPFVHLIHGVDSGRLLEAIEKEGRKCGREINCLLQLHVAVEETKFGLSCKECEDLLSGPLFVEMKYAKVNGLMAMASNTGDTAQIRKEFDSVRETAEKLRTERLPLETLSFGMSSDYQIAISAGSTMIRIGSTIFGERN